MQWIVFIVTVLILAAIGQTVLNLHDAGHYWIWIAFPVATIAAAYRLGEDEDRAMIRRALSWLTRGYPCRAANREERRPPEA